MLPIMHSTTRRDDNLESTATSNPSGTTDAIFTKLPCPLAKDRKKHFSELATYLAFFSVTYLATSLKLAKFRQASSDRECPMCLQRHLSNIF